MAMKDEVEEAPAAAVGRERCAGLDVHRSTIVGCATFPLGGGRLKKVWNEFATTARRLAAGAGGEPCRDGGDGGLLDAGLRGAGMSRLVRPDGRQSASRQGPAQAQDRCEGRGVAGLPRPP